MLWKYALRKENARRANLHVTSTSRDCIGPVCPNVRERDKIFRGKSEEPHFSNYLPRVLYVKKKEHSSFENICLFSIYKSWKEISVKQILTHLYEEILLFHKNIFLLLENNFF